MRHRSLSLSVGESSKEDSRPKDAVDTVLRFRRRGDLRDRRGRKRDTKESLNVRESRGSRGSDSRARSQVLFPLRRDPYGVVPALRLSSSESSNPAADGREANGKCSNDSTRVSRCEVSSCSIIVDEEESSYGWSRGFINASLILRSSATYLRD